MSTIKRAIVSDTSEGYAENRCLLVQKRRDLHRALVALGGEAAFVGAAVIAGSLA